MTGVAAPSTHLFESLARTPPPRSPLPRTPRRSAAVRRWRIDTRPDAQAPSGVGGSIPAPTLRRRPASADRYLPRRSAAVRRWRDRYPPRRSAAVRRRRDRFADGRIARRRRPNERNLFARGGRLERAARVPSRVGDAYRRDVVAGGRAALRGPSDIVRSVPGKRLGHRGLRLKGGTPPVAVPQHAQRWLVRGGDREPSPALERTEPGAWTLVVNGPRRIDREIERDVIGLADAAVVARVAERPIACVLLGRIARRSVARVRRARIRLRVRGRSGVG